MNLQQGTYNSVESLDESLSSDMTTWVDAIKDSVTKVSEGEV